jgi:pyrimidine-nucleoside phosphorylase
MNVIDLIKKKRDGGNLTFEEISFLINSYTNRKIPDYQFSAFLMAVCLNGMNEEETASLTKAMLYSGELINLKSVKGSKIDKHSTGGVGDKTSLILAPIVAAAGIYVPMISGRGLGHTGGTLDKLESITGFKTNLTLKKFKNIIEKCGAALIGQTDEIAPADKLIYSLRDVTATVESIPLITASIMSKKLAEGIDGLVLDVKTGSGAFMQKQSGSIKLANSLINAAKSFDKKVIAFITDMNQPLGNYIGNWLEVYESIKILKGEKQGDLYNISLLLSGAMIYLGEKANSIDEGKSIAEELVKKGKAFEKFLEIVKLQGGNAKLIENPESYPKARFKSLLKSKTKGFLAKIDTYQIGMAAADLGAGRKTKESKIDPAAGIIFNLEIGDEVKKGDVIAELFSNSKSKIEEAENRIKYALTFSDSTVKKPKLVKKIII